MKAGASKELVETALDVTRWAQIIALVKDNQLVTALGLFLLWQAGVLLTAYDTVGGAICG